MKEFNSSDNYEYLLAIVEMDENDSPSDIALMGYGCPNCMVNELIEQVKHGSIRHDNSHQKVH